LHASGFHLVCIVTICIDKICIVVVQLRRCSPVMRPCRTLAGPAAPARRIFCRLRLTAFRRDETIDTVIQVITVERLLSAPQQDPRRGTAPTNAEEVWCERLTLTMIS
jgi:hypothetical protein